MYERVKKYDAKTAVADKQWLVLAKSTKKFLEKLSACEMACPSRNNLMH